VRNVTLSGSESSPDWRVYDLKSRGGVSGIAGGCWVACLADKLARTACLNEVRKKLACLAHSFTPSRSGVEA